MINTQQMIVIMPLFNLNLPANAGIFYGFIMNIASFNLLPTGKFYNAYFDMQQDDPGAINQRFNVLGYSSMYFNYNMGTLMVAFAVLPLLFVLSLALKLLRNCSGLN
jgi:hypothetical protein